VWALFLFTGEGGLLSLLRFPGSHYGPTAFSHGLLDALRAPIKRGSRSLCRAAQHQAPWTKKDDRGGWRTVVASFRTLSQSPCFCPSRGAKVWCFVAGQGIWILRAACPHRLPESLKLWKRATISSRRV
jgi:hypothetical protein